jgi:hypothetical protein
MCKVLRRWCFCILQCYVSYIKVVIFIEIYNVSRPFYHVIGLTHALMDLSEFHIGTLGLPPHLTNFGRRVPWESPQPCRNNIFYAWFVKASLDRYTSRLLEYSCQDYYFLQYDIYVSYPNCVTWKNLYKLHDL